MNPNHFDAVANALSPQRAKPLRDPRPSTFDPNLMRSIHTWSQNMIEAMDENHFEDVIDGLNAGDRLLKIIHETVNRMAVAAHAHANGTEPVHTAPHEPPHPPARHGAY